MEDERCGKLGKSILVGEYQKERKAFSVFGLMIGLYLLVSCGIIVYFLGFAGSYADNYGKNQKEYSFIGQLKDSAISGDVSARCLPDASLNRVGTSDAGKKGSQADKKKRLLPCGIPVGIYLESRGILVTELAEVTTVDGRTVKPCGDRLEAGDYILEADSKAVESKEQFRKMVSACKGRSMKLKIERAGKEQELAIQPVLGSSGDYMAGIWIRDNMHGIGTLTWIDEDMNFAALGHSISDMDTGKRMEIDQGALYCAEIYSLVKGRAEHPGSLSGAIDYRKNACVGTVSANTEQGVFGTGNQALYRLAKEKLADFYEGTVSRGEYPQKESYKEDSYKNKLNQLWQQYAVEVAAEEEVHNGAAQMMNCFAGEQQLYDIEIKKITNQPEAYENMDLEITVTDPALLEKTGGILQGMSGSPILQDGKLVGAVTHVLVSDSAKGYGILAEKMEENNQG